MVSLSLDNVPLFWECNYSDNPKGLVHCYGTLDLRISLFLGAPKFKLSFF